MLYEVITGKAICKDKLLEDLGLAPGKEPVIGIVTRFVSHKGIDLIKYVFKDIIDLGYKFVILGSGEAIYENFFKEMMYRYPERVSVTIGFEPELARKIYAGADIFLMPSESEPCGLAQMVALRYGRITSYNVCYTKLLRCKNKNNHCENSTKLTVEKLFFSRI